MYFVSYVQVFIVFTRLARAAQPGDISFTSWSVLNCPASPLVKSELRLHPLLLARVSLPSLPGNPTLVQGIRGLVYCTVHLCFDVGDHLRPNPSCYWNILLRSGDVLDDRNLYWTEVGLFEGSLLHLVPRNFLNASSCIRRKW